jgi:hypothetical protein
MFINFQTQVIVILITFFYAFCNCSSSIADVIEFENKTFQPYCSPDKKGPHAFINTKEKNVLPLYMYNVKDITYRIPIQSNSIQPPFPTIIFEPGFFAHCKNYNDLLDYFASHGFLVIGVDNKSHRKLITRTLEAYHYALLETLQFVIKCNSDENSQLFRLIDTNAIGLSGHSMGGGGALRACNSTFISLTKYIAAIIAMNPYGKVTADNITIPTLLFASSRDNACNPCMKSGTASPENVYLSYKSIPVSTNKLFANFNGMDHNAVRDYTIFFATSGNAFTFMPLMLAWFKIYLLKDNRYSTWIEISGMGYDSLKTRYAPKNMVPAYQFNH